MTLKAFNCKFLYEKRLWRRKVKVIAGVDEVGRGCFAGPVVAAAVSFSKYTIIPEAIYIYDSKKLSEKRRRISGEWIKKNALTWGIGEASVTEINRIGMAKATKVAFRRAVGNANVRLNGRIEFLLIDAFYVPYLKGFPQKKKAARKNHELKDSRARQLAIINGDSKSLSIAASSIVAKVYRDLLMEKIGNKKAYLVYGWRENKGYGTKKHRDAILKYGTTKYHRKQFVDTFLKKANFES